MEQIEIWKDIDGYIGFYQISNLGRVKCLQREIIRSGDIKKNHTRKFTLNEQIKRTAFDKDKYQIVALNKDGKSKMHKIHRLIAKAFIPNPENKPQVNHIDGNPSNNSISNLEWVTNRENTIHAFKFLNRNEKRYKIEQFNNKKVLQYDKKGNLLNTYTTRAEASRKTGVNQSDICKCANNKKQTAGGFIWKNE